MEAQILILIEGNHINEAITDGEMLNMHSGLTLAFIIVV